MNPGHHHHYLGYLTTPPSSSRTETGKNQCSGGCTTRRSAGKMTPQNTFNGIYEGDFTMFKSSSSTSTAGNYNNHRSNLDQYLGETLDLGLEQNEEPAEHMVDPLEQLYDEADEIVDEEIRGKSVEPHAVDKKKFMSSSSSSSSSTSLSRSLWDDYKQTIFSAEQCKHIEANMTKIQQNIIFRKISFTAKCIAVLTVWLIRLLLYSVVVRGFDSVYSTLRRRNIMRIVTRRLLWCMTLSRFGDLQLYGLIMLLSPFLFLTAFVGFIISTYNEIKNGIYAAINHVRNRLDSEPDKFD